MTDLSIIIVSYKSKDTLGTTLDSVFGSAMPYSYEVIVVDNGSGDGTAEMVQGQYLQTILIRNVNNGFSAGCNIGLNRASGRIALLLNPDTKLETNTLGECVSLMDKRSDIGILGCKIIKEDGTLDLACRRSFPNLANSFFRLSGLAKFFPNSAAISSYNLTNLPEDQETEVDSVMGAFLMIKREVIDKIGLLDEDFFMYGEDLDWCWRCKQAGYKVYYYPKVICHHYKGSSSRKVPYLALRAFYNAMWIFYKKHYASRYPAALNGLVYLGIKARFAVFWTMNFFRKEKFVSK